jgi:hypothetical protein
MNADIRRSEDTLSEVRAARPVAIWYRPTARNLRFSVFINNGGSGSKYES